MCAHSWHSGSTNTKIRYASLFFSVSGIYLSATTACTWLANNVTPHLRRATALAFGLAMSNIGGILATWLFGGLSTPPHYRTGTLVLMIFGVVDFFGAIFCMMYFSMKNRQKDRVRRSIPEDEKGWIGFFRIYVVIVRLLAVCSGFYIYFTQSFNSQWN